MRANHIYLISSLPMLHFGARAPFSSRHFLDLCQRFVSEDDFNILKSSDINGEYDYEARQPTLKRWYEFDTDLRNELAKVRASHRKIDPDKYLRRYRYTPASITNLAISAHRNPSIIDGQKVLDEERWRMLEELSSGHYFDLDFLIIYALKLLILESRDRAAGADKGLLIEEALG